MSKTGELKMNNLICKVYPFATYEDCGTRTLSEMMYQAPFVWYNSTQVVNPNDHNAVQQFYLERLLNNFADVESSGVATSGEFAVTRLPVGVSLLNVVAQLPALQEELELRGGWHFATIREAPLFVEAHYGRIHFGDMPGWTKSLWCLGSPVKVLTTDGTNTMKVHVGRFHTANVPAVLYPFISWTRANLPENKLVHGWDISLRHVTWAWSLNEHIVQGRGVPILLVR